MTNIHKSIAVIAATVTTLGFTSLSADENGPECRGVAAGVVATMRAAGELSTQDASDAAVLAARRACAAAREDLGPAVVVEQAAVQNAEAEAEAEATTAKEEPTVWELLSRDRERKPGNERLRRLKTQ